MKRIIRREEQGTVISRRDKSALMKNNGHDPALDGKSTCGMHRRINSLRVLWARGLHLRVKHAHQRCTLVDKAPLYRITRGCKTNPRRARCLPAGRWFTHYASRGVFRRECNKYAQGVQVSAPYPLLPPLGAPITRLLLR